MKYTAGQTGRVFVARLEDGDHIYESVEGIAQRERIHSGLVWIVGGITSATVVVGPEHKHEMPPKPMIERFNDVREILGIGTLFEDSQGIPKLHLHAAMGRGKLSLVGCPRQGADCWLVDEVVILEITNLAVTRIKDAASGFDLLTVSDAPAAGAG